ncbi:MAG TPA: N-acetylmuramoyl-L-alanine amidase [Candidatus Limnocylindria bacterium]|nr:N-acetylmuramoyl-L-alanine amidase [Candidatus Limnocylindria bacterium]
MRSVIRAVAVAIALLLAACGADLPVETPTHAPSTAPAPSAVTPAPTAGAVEAAPGSDSQIYPPNPGAIVVAIDAGHGGCLDWGVPDPSERGVQLAEKTLTLGIAEALRDLLEADGVGVVMIRDADEALAGDDYPPLGCEGAPFRDVNGDGMSGFGNDDLPEATRTRDELQARLDLANLARADALVSIHINSPFDAGQPVEIAFSETFYTDETPWGVDATARLAQGIESGVVARLGDIADYDRGDRGTTAHNFYLVAPPLVEETEERPNRWAQPTRGGLMPVVLSEVGSITLRAEHDLLASDAGQSAVAAGLFDGLAAFFEDRSLAARIGLADEGPSAPSEVPGDGPPFWPHVATDGPMRLTLTNNGTQVWPSDVELVAGWGETEQPYLAFPPETLEALDVTIPPLAPGESVTVEATLPAAPEGRSVAWISLREGSELFSDLGSPALQVSSQAP